MGPARLREAAGSGVADVLIGCGKLAAASQGIRAVVARVVADLEVVGELTPTRLREAPRAG